MTIKHEPALRAIIHQYRTGLISGDEFIYQAEEQVKLIRNDDLRPNAIADYDEEAYDEYMLNYQPFGMKVKLRLTRFLGYIPNVKHSLAGENYLRALHAFDSYILPDTLTESDYMAITIIKYREILLDHGKNAADASPLWAMALRAKHKNKI